MSGSLLYTFLCFAKMLFDEYVHLFQFFALFSQTSLLCSCKRQLFFFMGKKVALSIFLIILQNKNSTINLLKIIFM